MAGYTSRILLTLSIPSFVIIITALWFLRKRKAFSETSSDCSQIQEDCNSHIQHTCPVVISMNLKEVKESLLIQQSVYSVKSTLSDMQLKEDSLTASEQAGKHHTEVNGKDVSVESKACENGATCSFVAVKQDNVTNGATLSKCDKAGDSGSLSAPSKTSRDMNMNGTSDSNEDYESHLVNGVHSLNLDAKNEFASHNGNNDVTEHHFPEDTCTGNGCFNGSLPTKKLELQTSVDIPDESSMSNNAHPMLSDMACNDVTTELTCETDFVPKASTPDSCLSAELQGSDTASSPLSVPSSDGRCGETLISPLPSLVSNDDDNLNSQAIAQDTENEVFSENTPVMYEFEIPQELCGLLIGRRGRHVRYIKEQSNAEILIKQHPYFGHMKSCVISGTNSEISAALCLIRERFPIEKYSSITLENLASMQPVCQCPVTLKLSLPEGVSFDVILTSVVNPGYFFVHQPTHPTYHSLSIISRTMSQFYSTWDTPRLYHFAVGYVVAAPVDAGWYRSEITDIDEENRTAVVKILDFGGYATVSLDDLRQLNSSFLSIPFQAAECYLGDVTYPEGEEGWSEEGKQALESLAYGQVISGCIVGHDKVTGIPHVHLYCGQGQSYVYINRELVERGFARWTRESEQTESQ